MSDRPAAVISLASYTIVLPDGTARRVFREDRVLRVEDAEDELPTEPRGELTTYVE